RQPERTQPSRDAAIDQLSLGLGQTDAGHLLDEIAERAKIRVAEFIFAVGFLADGGGGAVLIHAAARVCVTRLRPAPAILPKTNHVRSAHRRRAASPCGRRRSRETR